MSVIITVKRLPPYIHISMQNEIPCFKKTKYTLTQGYIYENLRLCA